MTTPQQPGSLFELQFPQSVGIFNTYADAQKAVDYLADEKFEVQNLAIVGTDLKSVERVLGRRSWGTVLNQGVMSGISTGLLVALVMLIFSGPRASSPCCWSRWPSASCSASGSPRPRTPEPGSAGLHLGHPDGGHQVRGAL